VIDPLFNRQLSGVRRAKHLLWFCTRLWVLPLLRLTIGMRIYGLKHVPKRGGAVVIANHLDWFDPILLVAAGPRPILWMAKAEVFNFPVLRWFARQAGAFPVDRGKPDRTALRHAQQLLADGLLVGVFPEGTRSRTGGLIQPFPGASMVATRSGAPIIPCAIVGSERLPLSGKKPQERGRTRVSVIYGEPFRLDTHRPDGTKYHLDELTDAMLIELARQLPAPYRGVYADRVLDPHPAVRRDGVCFTGANRR
jgi:1-acyl-sn-glycerol-3-phosphate acyltransferase